MKLDRTAEKNIDAPNDILATPYELKNAGYRPGLADRVERL
jgi:hypothetical protein